EAPGDFSDVVIVYFQGEMRREKNGKRYLLMWSDDDKESLEERSIDCDHIRKVLGDVLGAKLLLLDVKGEKESAGPIADASGLIGDFQYVWLGGANDRSRRRLLEDLHQTLAQAQQWGAVRRELLSVRDKEVKLTIQSVNPEGYDGIALKKARD